MKGIPSNKKLSSYPSKQIMNGLTTEVRVKKAVILAGGQKTQLAPLTNYCPIWMFPVLNKPLIESTINFLKKSGFEEIILAVSGEKQAPEYLTQNKVSGIKVTLHKEDRPRGTAGILKDLERYLETDPFLVINGNLFVEGIDLNNLITFHTETDSMATIGVNREKNGNGVEENISITGDRTVKSFHIIHHSIDRRSPWRPSGIYLFNPSVLRFIDQEHYMDIKEQLIPALQRADFTISAYEINGLNHSINSMSDYITIHRNILLNGNGADFRRKEEISKGVWVGKDVEISQDAFLLGPIIIGDGCKIEDRVQIIGPTVIGNGCHIAKGVLIRESILWDGASLSNHSHVEYSIIGDSSNIPENFNAKNMIVLNGLKVGDANLIPSDYNINGVIDLSDIISAGTQKLYKIAKRTMDVVFSAIGIVLFVPLFLLIAIAVKIDSPGPVFYLQKRCGLRGKLFNMLKFRTMVEDAEKLQKDLISKNGVDGPVFKIPDDPRATKLGRILRRTSLDEIPQLLNVLKGEMSLVGPRPLIMDEMKFCPSWRDARLKIKPGITGLWQIQGRSKAPFHDWIRYDMFYVKNQSLWLDIKILCKTIKAVLKKAGAY